MCVTALENNQSATSIILSDHILSTESLVADSLADDPGQVDEGQKIWFLI